LANYVNLAFHPSGVGKLIVIHVFTWITEVHTVNNGGRGAAYGCMTAHIKVRERGLGLLLGLS